MELDVHSLDMLPAQAQSRQGPCCVTCVIATNSIFSSWF
jgi:hypothetical protein